MATRDNDAQRRHAPPEVGPTSVDADEVAQFSRLAAEWWEPAGKFRPLHRLNPVRIGYVRDVSGRHFGRDVMGPRPLQGLSVLDVGCGGGLLAEPLARLGAAVVGIDADERSVRVAALHAADAGLTIDYRRSTAEEVAAAGERFDMVLAMEVIEHVADVDRFLSACVQLMAPGGLLFVATLNRTAKAFGLAIVGAEYLLGWLPRGTHDWRKFVRPAELAVGLRRHGAVLTGVTGVIYQPLSGTFALAPHQLDVNYMGWATAAA